MKLSDTMPDLAYLVDVTQIVANSTTFIALIFTMIMVVISYKDYKSKKYNEVKIQAIELAKCFQEKIIPYANYVSFIIVNTPKVHEILNKIQLSADTQFSEDELSVCIAKEELQILKDFFSGKNIDVKVLIEASMQISCFQNADILINADKFILSGNNGKLQTITENAHLQFTTNITNVLNILEHFSMTLNYKIADEEVIYQSLHQIFIVMVKFLYPIICWHNENVADKYFTNIIELFFSWNARFIEQSEKEKRSNYELKEKINSITKKKHAELIVSGKKLK